MSLTHLYMLVVLVQMCFGEGLSDNRKTYCVVFLLQNKLATKLITKTFVNNKGSITNITLSISLYIKIYLKKLYVFGRKTFPVAVI